MDPRLRRFALLSILAAGTAGAQAELTPPPLPPPDAPAPGEPLPPLGVLVPKAINNPPLPAQPPAPAPPAEEPERFGRRFGPMGHLALNHVNALWSRSSILPGLAGSLGMRFALMPRRDTSEFNLAVGAFFGVESANWVPVLSPGVRFELLGAKAHVLIPYLSLSAFAQLLAPLDGSSVGARVGLGFAWNIVAASSGEWTGGGWGGWGSGSGSWLLIPVAIIGAMIVFGDVRVYLQPDPRTGGVLGGLSLGLGF